MSNDTTTATTVPAGTTDSKKNKKRRESKPKAPRKPRVQRTPEEEAARNRALLEKAEKREKNAAQRAADLRDRLSGKLPQKQRAKIAGRALRILGELRDKVFAGVDVTADHDPNSPDAERVQAMQAICASINACEAIEDGAL